MATSMLGSSDFKRYDLALLARTSFFGSDRLFVAATPPLRRASWFV
jgi:hypothetical protein